MKTLADFKRAIHTGMEIECVRFEVKAWSFDERRTYIGEFYDIHIAEKLQGAQYVSHIDTTGFYLNQVNDKTVPRSFCGWPKARDISFDGDTFVMTDRDSRGNEYQKRHYKITIK